MNENFIIVEKPIFHYALTEDVIKNCPTTLDNKVIEAKDFIPSRTRDSDAAYDLRCAETNEIKLSSGTVKGIELKPGCYFKMKLGFRAFIEKDWWLNLAPRSGTFINKHIHALYGIIDCAFESEYMFVGQYLPDSCDLIPTSDRHVIKFGERIAQVVVVPRYSQEAKISSNEEIDAMYKQRNDPRGQGGFGSSGAA